MYLQSRRPFAFGLALTIASLAAPVAAAEEPEAHPYFSREALEQMGFGVNAMLSVGTGSFTDTSTTAFYAPDTGSSGDAPQRFGSGMNVELQAGLLFGNSLTLGVARTWQSLSTVGAMSDGSGGQIIHGPGSSHGASTWLGFVRTQGVDTIAPFFEASLGSGTFTGDTKGEFRVNDAVTGTFEQKATISAFVLRAKAGLDFAPVASLPNLRFGGHVAGELWTPMNLCVSSPGMPEVCDTSNYTETPNVGWNFGLGARFALPVSKAPRPPEREYVLVESELRVATTDGSEAEVTDTPRYREELASVKTVALQAPSECTSQTAAAATGQAAATGTVVKTFCGVEMGEIERELTKQGFIVQSWSTLASMVQEQRLTPTQAAEKLGAQVLFQINSLERVQGTPAAGARWERRFYRSDEMGNQGAPLELPDTEGSLLSNMVKQREDKELTGSRLGAMLDVNAILVSTGQTIWFYRWQKLDTGEMTTTLKALATRLPPDGWMKTEPHRPANDSLSLSEARSWKQVEEAQRAQRPENERDALYFQLMREVVRDFVTRFTGKPGSH